MIASKSGARIIAYVILSWLLIDGYVHLILPPPRAKVLVYDLVGVGCSCPCCEARDRLGVLGFRTLDGDSIVVIVAHGFSSGGTFGIEVSGDVWELLLHPLMVLTGAVALGVVDDKFYLAVTDRISVFSRRMSDTTIVLITCGGEGLDKLALSLARLGARVAYLNHTLTREDASILCSYVASLACRGVLNDARLEVLGFKVVRTRETLPTELVGFSIVVVHALASIAMLRSSLAQHLRVKRYFLTRATRT